MAWSSASLAADEITWAAADKPLVAPVNVLAGNLATAYWHNSAHTALNSAGTVLFDGHAASTTEPSSTSAFHTIEFVATTVLPDFDCIAIVNNNFAANPSDVLVEIADDAAYTSNALTIKTFATASTGDRLVALSLDTNKRFTDVKYLRIKITPTGAVYKPAIGEVFVGRRRQFPRESMLPYDPWARGAYFSRTTSESGLIRDYEVRAGGREFAVSMREWNTTRIADLKAWLTESNYGSRTFMWIDDPASAPGDAILARFDRAVGALPYGGPFDVTMSADVVEQGPSDHYRANE